MPEPLHALALSLALLSSACLAASRCRGWRSWLPSAGMLALMSLAVAPHLETVAILTSAAALFAIGAVAARRDRADAMERHRAFGAVVMAVLVVLHTIGRAGSELPPATPHGHSGFELPLMLGAVVAGAYVVYSIAVAVPAARPTGGDRRPFRRALRLGEIAGMALGSAAMVSM
jgi:hypothetical protein